MNEQGKLTEIARRVDAADGGLQRLVALQVLAEAVAEATAQAVAVARSERAKWEQIGTALGVSRQAAQQRFKPSAVGPADESPATGEPTPDGKAPGRRPAQTSRRSKAKLLELGFWVRCNRRLFGRRP